MLQSFSRNNTRDTSLTCLLAFRGHWIIVAVVEGCAESTSCIDGSVWEPRPSIQVPWENTRLFQGFKLRHRSGVLLGSL